MVTGQSFSVPADISTPALVVDLSVVEQNLSEMAALCRESGVSLVPHAKTHRTVELGLLQMSYGAQGLAVAKLGEAEAFVNAGVDRIIVAYPLVGPDKLHRASSLAQRSRITLGTDSLEGARAIGEHFAQRGAQADVYLIVDSGFQRCGVRPEAVPTLASTISDMAGITLSGIMTHEGHVYQAVDQDDLARRSRAAATLMTECAGRVRSLGLALPVVSVGSSASARTAAGVPGVTEVRPGIYAFNDLGQVALGNATPATCALRVIATVVSNPEPGHACIDAGSKALSQDQLPEPGSKRYPGFGLIEDLPGWRLARLSEEHGWLRWHGDGPAPPLDIGQRVRIIPNHVCMVFASLGESVAVRGGQVVATWRTIGPGASQ